MKQPDLGKKITELRLAKGLTQGELAEKCNVSLRTIQRIESAEVTPRSYTVKLIFESLDYEIYNSFGRFSYKLDRTAYRLRIWLGQFFKNVVDLFNLKTHPMKKIVILLIPVLLIGLLVSMSLYHSHNHFKEARLAYDRLDSTYRYVEWFNKGEMDSISAYYMSDIWSMHDNAPVIRGIENNKEHLLAGYNMGIRFVDVKKTFSIVTDTIAFERGEWKVSVNHLIVSGYYMTQLRYYKGRWMIENTMDRTDKILPMVSSAEGK
jgi:DNA-binding XRE family transcriptional regulator